MKIITNNHKRDLLCWFELTDKEKSDLDWIENPDDYGLDFFRYKDNIYCLNEFMPCSTNPNDDFRMWDGYSSDSFFSGILVKWFKEEWGDIDTDHIIVGWYYS